MRLIGMVRFSMGTIMMFVLMAAAAMALFVKVYEYSDPLPMGWKVDVPSLFLLAIGLTAMALGCWKEHTASQIMLQVTIACVGCLTLIWVAESEYERAIRYWCQSAFAASVTLPMLARRLVKSRMPRGPRREWWKKTCEAAFFAFLTVILVSAGALYQAGVYVVAMQVVIPASRTAAAVRVTTTTPGPPASPAAPTKSAAPTKPAAPSTKSIPNDDELGLIPDPATPKPAAPTPKKAARKGAGKP